MTYFNGLLIGVVGGAQYSLIAISVTLMYRSTGVLSFAHAAFAMLGAYIYADLAGHHGWPRPLAAALALVVVVAYGMAVERVAIRPVQRASATTKLIVTLGVLSATTGIVLLIYGFEPTSSPLLLPAGLVHVGSLAVTYQQLAIFATAAGGSVALGWFLRVTRFGTAIRAVAQKAETARLMGISLAQVGRFNWALGAALAATTGILIAPLAPVTAATFPLVMVKALTASLFGGLVSLPLTFLGGLAVGVVESITVLRSSTPGAPELAVLVLVLALLVLRRRWPEVATDEGGTSDPQPAGQRVWAGALRTRLRLSPSLVALAARVRWPSVVVASAVLLLPARSEYWGFVGARSLFYVIEALSLVLLVGWSGQVSLMHGAYVGIGAFMTGLLVQGHGVPLEIALPLAAVCGLVVGALAGIPALRLTGLQFAIASLAFAAAAAEWFFRRPEFSLSRNLGRGHLFGIDLFNSGSLYLVMLPVTVACYLAVWRVRRTTYGALLMASRDASTTVAHFGANPRRTRMWSFGLASLIASLGGAFYGLLLTSFGPLDFGFQLSLTLLLYAVIGGIDSLAGPALAGLLFGVIPELVQGRASTSGNAWPDVISGLLVIGLMAFRPAGLASLVHRRAGESTAVPPTRRRQRFGRFAPLAGIAVAGAVHDDPIVANTSGPATTAPGAPVVEGAPA